MKKPRTKNRDVRFQEIQAAAKMVFLQKGYNNTSVEEIAKKAGISKGTVYLYFKNKHEVYIALMMPVLEEVGRELVKLENRVKKHKYRTCEEFFKGILKALWHSYEYDPEGIKTLLAFLQGNHFSAMSNETVQKINSRAQANYETIREALSHSIKLGLMRKVKVAPLADFIWGTFLGVIEVEESKFRITKKNHIFSTLKYAFSIISEGVCFINNNQ